MANESTTPPVSADGKTPPASAVEKATDKIITDADKAAVIVADPIVELQTRAVKLVAALADPIPIGGKNSEVSLNTSLEGHSLFTLDYKHNVKEAPEATKKEAFVASVSVPHARIASAMYTSDVTTDNGQKSLKLGVVPEQNVTGESYLGNEAKESPVLSRNARTMPGMDNGAGIRYIQSRKTGDGATVNLQGQIVARTDGAVALEKSNGAPDKEISVGYSSADRQIATSITAYEAHRKPGVEVDAQQKWQQGPVSAVISGGVVAQRMGSVKHAELEMSKSVDVAGMEATAYARVQALNATGSDLPAGVRAGDHKTLAVGLAKEMVASGDIVTVFSAVAVGDGHPQLQAGVTMGDAGKARTIHK